MAEIADNTPTRARLKPQHRQPEVEVYRLGEGMAAMLSAASWIAGRREGYTVPFCDDTGLLMRHGDGDPDDEYVWNEWIAAGSVLIWSPPGVGNGGLYGEVALSYLDDYDVIGPTTTEETQP